MKPVFTSDEMRNRDRAAIESYGIPGIVLMENAAGNAAETAANMLEDITNSHVCVCCGKGNNGGDGYAIARHLLNRGAMVTVCSMSGHDELRGDAATNFAILRNMRTERLHMTTCEGTDDIGQILAVRYDLIIDALLGTGLASSVTGPYADVVAAINGSSVPVLAIDIPSGISADSGEELGIAIRAARTATMGGLKRGLLMHEGRRLAGSIEVVDIGIPRELLDDVSHTTWMPEEADITAWLPERPFDAHKYQMGKVFVLAGSPGMTGAAAMASEAALRTGAGIVRLGIPASLNAIMEVKLTEVMTVPFEETSENTFSITALPVIRDMVDTSSVAIIGPGISRNDETAELVRRLIEQVHTPLIIDADALFALTGHLDILHGAAVPPVLTPHTGELSRLTGMPSADIEHDRVEAARRFAMEHHAVLVLKGAPTITALPEGRVFLNPTGNPGMATAGSGDVLAGIIGGLMAQGMGMEKATCSGVFLHGLAGDRAIMDVGQQGLVATDLIVALTRYFAHIHEHVT